MARAELIAAADALNDAADAADGETAKKLAEQADTVATLAEREKGPDHGRLAKLEHTLRSLQDEGGEVVSGHVDDALAHSKAYRSTVDGV